MPEPTTLHPRLRRLSDELRESEQELERLNAKIARGEHLNLAEMAVLLDKDRFQVSEDCRLGWIEGATKTDGGYSVPANEAARKLANVMKLERQRSETEAEKNAALAAKKKADAEKLLAEADALGSEA